MDLNNDIAAFRHALRAWFRRSGRDLPWRNRSSSWYPIFLSEFLLQQTQVEQALPYYQRFIDNYPEIITLAEADEEEILTLWSGLGYYARARNMLKAAREIVQTHNGNFPETYEEAIRLPGIGPYTASAILSIAFSHPLPVIDGNVLRVISRIQAIGDDIRKSSTLKKIKEISKALIDPQHPGSYNEAVMELGATICRPKQPLCKECPVNEYCLSRQKGLQSRIPVKSSAGKKKTRKQIVFAVMKEGRLLLVKRPSNGLLGSMWEFPNLDSTRLRHSKDDLMQFLKEGYGISGKLLHLSEPMSHTYSHFRLNYRPVLVDMEGGDIRVRQHVGWRWQDFNELDNIPLHQAHRKIFNWLRTLEIEPKG